VHLLSRLNQRARLSGFVALGLAAPQRPPHIEHFQKWLRNGKHAGLQWMARNAELRADPRKLLTGCRAVICMAYPYSARKPCTPEGLAVARYADPSEQDYHLKLKALAEELVHAIEESFPASRSRIFVDSAPLLERSIAYAAGLGFIGKNNMLILPGLGSYLFLAEILTTAPLQFSPAEPIESLCGNCRLCIDACPTGALEKPFSLDAGRCLSYLTIEYDGALDATTGTRMGTCFLGCDKCQEVCPFNRHQEAEKISLPHAGEILGMEEPTFKERFGRTSLSRAGLRKVKRNILAIQATGRRPFCPS